MTSSILSEATDFKWKSIVPEKECQNDNITDILTNKNGVIDLLTKKFEEFEMQKNETDCYEGFCGYPCKTKNQNTASLSFLIFYVILLLIQFGCMLVHRWSSLMTFFQLRVCSWSAWKAEFSSKGLKGQLARPAYGSKSEYSSRSRNSNVRGWYTRGRTMPVNEEVDVSGETMFEHMC